MDLPPPPSIESVQQIGIDDLGHSNVLMEWVRSIIDASEGDYHEQRELSAMKQLPIPTRDYYVIFSFDGKWGNGGMQSIVLNDDLDYTVAFLDATSQAFERYNCPKISVFVESLISKTKVWMARSDQLTAENASESAWEELWDEIDLLDEIYDNLSETSGSAYEAIALGIRENPSTFVTIAP